MPDYLKIVGLMASALIAAVQAIKPITARLERIQELRSRRGEFGKTFFYCYELWQYAYRAILLLLALAGVVAIIGFVGKLTGSEFLRSLEHFFDSYAIYLIVVWLLIGIVSYSNIISYGLLYIVWVLPGFRRSTSWINATWFCTSTDRPVPIVIRPTSVLSVSDRVLERLVNGEGKDPNRAVIPVDISCEERANVALFGCILEQEHRVLGWGRRPWGVFYDCLSSLQMNGQSLFNSNVVRSFDQEEKSYFEAIRDPLNRCLVSRGHTEIPESAEAADAIRKTLILLQEKYDGTAASLARSNLPFHKSLDMARAFRRAKEFPCLNNDSMRPQCLKLMLVWDVWPNIQPGTFIYPFAANLAAYLVSENVLITFDNIDTLPFAKGRARAVYQEAMKRIVANVTDHLTTSRMNNYRTFKRELEAASSHPLEWEIARQVDFFLWSHSNDLDKRDGFEGWRLNKQRLVVRKS